jgi:hypothetical protein
MKTKCVIFLAVVAALIGGAAKLQAASTVDKDYVRSLAAPGKTVLVIEYFGGDQKPVGRKGYASTSGFEILSATDFALDDKTRLHLYGLEPCRGDMVNAWEGFTGTCADFAQQQLADLMKSPKVIFCRAFVSEQNRPVQDVTCYGYYYFPGSLDAVFCLEEQLLSTGAVKLAKKTDGTVMRPDLVSAEQIGRGGFGMWADPRVQGQ